MEPETFAAVSPEGSQPRAVLHIRGLPGITAADQLLEVGRNYTWKIAGIREDIPNNEIVLEAYR